MFCLSDLSRHLDDRPQHVDIRDRAFMPQPLSRLADRANRDRLPYVDIRDQAFVREPLVLMIDRIILTGFLSLTSAIERSSGNRCLDDLSRHSRPPLHVDICDRAFVLR